MRPSVVQLAARFEMHGSRGSIRKWELDTREDALKT